jgi:molybdenum-dependent DNA-binding transcriptional regulator ModE
MAMDRIEDLQAFVAVVEKGSLTAAARQLGRSLQSVSRSLAALERGIGVELVRRTTRRSTPTEAGLAFHRRLSAALAEVEAATLEASNRGLQVTGLLRITSSTAFAPLHVVPAVRAFLEAHPKLDLNSICPIVMLTSSARASTLLFASANCPTRTSRPSTWQISGVWSSLPQAIWLSTLGRVARKTLSITNALSAPWRAMATLGRSLSMGDARS